MCRVGSSGEVGLKPGGAGKGPLQNVACSPVSAGMPLCTSPVHPIEPYYLGPEYWQMKLRAVLAEGEKRNLGDLIRISFLGVPNTQEALCQAT